MAYTITATGTGGTVGGSGIVICQFAEWSSVTANGTDGFNSNFTSSSSGAFSSGSITTTANGELVIGGIMVSGGAWTVGSGFTLLTNSGNGDFTEYQTQTSSGAINPSFGNASSGLTVVGATGAFKKSGGSFGTAAQQKVGAAGAASSVIITPTSTPTAGDFLVAVVSTKSWSVLNTGFTVTDSDGTSWTQLGILSNGTTTKAIGIFYLLSYGKKPPAGQIPPFFFGKSH